MGVYGHDALTSNIDKLLHGMLLKMAVFIGIQSPSVLGHRQAYLPPVVGNAVIQDSGGTDPHAAGFLSCNR